MAEQDRNQIFQGTLDMLVLKTLSGGPMHGYAIARRIQQASNEFLKVEEGSLYPALHRMERRGWIEAEWGLSEANRRHQVLPANGRRTRRVEGRSGGLDRFYGRGIRRPGLGAGPGLSRSCQGNRRL